MLQFPIGSKGVATQCLDQGGSHQISQPTDQLAGAHHIRMSGWDGDIKIDGDNTISSSLEAPLHSNI